MGATAFQRTGVVFLLVGLCLGMRMGMSQDFTLTPVHTHLNLAGGVLMFVAGLFYAQRPEIPRWAVTLHYWLHLVGAILLVVGIVAWDSHNYVKFMQANKLDFMSDKGKFEPHSWIPLKDYQRNRILTFAAPDVIDPSGTKDAWNLNQSLISVGSGGLTGKGWT